MRTSIDRSGQASRTLTIVSAQSAAPPSGRSSRSTLVMTMCLSSVPRSASATRRGSWRSVVVGLPVLTLQKPQARVQVSPRIMIVATPRVQHSPKLGHDASWHTVFRPCASMFDFVVLYACPPGTLAFSHGGFFCIWSCCAWSLLRTMVVRLRVLGAFLMGSPPRGFGCLAMVFERFRGV